MPASSLLARKINDQHGHAASSLLARNINDMDNIRVDLLARNINDINNICPSVSESKESKYWFGQIFRISGLFVGIGYEYKTTHTCQVSNIRERHRINLRTIQSK